MAHIFSKTERLHMHARTYMEQSVVAVMTLVVRDKYLDSATSDTFL